MDEFDKPNPKVLTIADVETNKNYALVISTNSGLWRYLIGDTIKFTSIFPHKILISGRTKHFINAFGEEIIIDNAEQALRIACKKTKSQISDYTAAPVFMKDRTKGKHEWLIEFSQAPKNMEEFEFALDEALMECNSDYEAKRYKSITLDKPIIHQASPYTFYTWLAEKGKLGGQNKVPRLSNDRTYMDELLPIHHRLQKQIRN